MRNAAAGLAFAFVAVTSALRAQSVRGTLTDSATRDPIPGAVVVVFDSAGHGLSRSISDDRGRYAVYRPALSRTLHITRIGFRPRDIVLAQDSVVDARLQTIPAMLHEMRASDERVCSDGPNTAAALQLWEQARAGLLAGVVSRETNTPNIRLRTFHRVFDPVTRRMVGDTVQYTDIVDGRSFVAARPPWVFADYGYLREERDGTRDYYAPDDGVLLDPTFAGTHCVHVIEGRGPRAEQIGLAFDPIDTPERDTIVDVTGALWLDRATFAPRTIEFHYTNLERENRESGGEIDFTVMPNGVSMIAKWEIRSAVLAMDVPGEPTLRRRVVPRPERRGVRILGYSQIGGQIASATWPDGKRFEGDLPHIQGFVRTVDGTPVRGAVVWARNAPDTVRTDSSGYYRFPPMEPGLYAVSASDSVLAPLGLARTIAVGRTLLTVGNADVDLEYHSRSEVFPLICPAHSYRPGTGVVLARVLDSRGKPASSARLEIETHRGPAEQSELIGRRNGITADDGAFVVCGAERDHRLIVRAFKGTEGAGVSIDRWGDEVVGVKLTLQPLKP